VQLGRSRIDFGKGKTNCILAYASPESPGLHHRSDSEESLRCEIENAVATLTPSTGVPPDGKESHNHLLNFCKKFDCNRRLH
jgi:hypothetical protein